MSRRPHRFGRRVCRWVSVVAAAVCVAGCAAIPQGGPINRVDPQTGQSGSTERFQPAPPRPGGSPAAIVRGFLDAMLAYPVSAKIATTFLTPQATEDWKPGAKTVIYSSPKIVELSVGGTRARVEITFTKAAELDAQGRWSPAAGRESILLELERVDGEWRIAGPPEGSLVTQNFFDDYIRGFELFFIDRDRGILVPDPVYHVVGDQLATRLVAALAAGHEPASQASVTSALPPADGLRPSVPIDAAGVADVVFDREPATRDENSDRDLSAQIVWTLRQVLGVKAVRIRVAGDVLAPSGDPVQPTDSLRQFDPGRADRRVGLVARWGVAVIDGRDAEEIPVPAEATAVALGNRMAALIGDNVRILHRDGREIDTVTGRELLEPVVDVDDAIWIVESSGRVRVYGDEVRVVGRLPGVTSFDISPDGARYVAVVSGRLVIGSVNREEGVVATLGPPRDLDTRMGEARRATWLDSTHVVHLTKVDDGPPQAWTTRIDGSVTRAVGTGPVIATTEIGRLTDLAVAGAATPRIYALDHRGEVWILDGGSWSPTFLGDVTAIG